MSSARYDLLGVLGTGNFTAGVHRARHRDLGREVAVKLLALGAVSDRAALLAEAQRMAALQSHANVVAVLDAGDWDASHVYIASELCLGGSMESLCATPLDPARACSLVSGACRGLDYMHREGMLHLDVRPANILLDGDVPKVADFGLARWLTDTQVSHVYAAHAAPEMLLSHQGTEHSDQYAMGMTLAHALTGGTVCVSPPSPVTTANWRGFPDIRGALAPNVPERLVRVLVKATRYDPSDRFDSIEEFKRAVDQATPSVSFSAVTPEVLSSADGQWEIESGLRRSGWSVDVRRGGRRVGARSASGLDEASAHRHVASTVTDLAYG